MATTSLNFIKNHPSTIQTDKQTVAKTHPADNSIRCEATEMSHMCSSDKYDYRVTVTNDQYMQTY